MKLFAPCSQATSLPIRVFHIIPDLRIGGAELMLMRLVCNSDRSQFEHRVLSLRSRGDLGNALEQAGIQVTELGISTGAGGLLKVRALANAICAWRPNIVHTWLYHANVVGGVAARLFSKAKIVWGLHTGWLDRDQTKALTLLMRTLGARLSGFIPDRIVCCAHSILEFHAGLGFAREKMVVVPNGVDIAVFQPDPNARRELRAELGIAPDQLLIGMVSRLDPQKDFGTFVDAAKLVVMRYPNARFILCGRGFEPDNSAVSMLLNSRGLLRHFHLLGLRFDVPRIMASLDLLVVSSSYGEAFPLVIAEAMACGVPVIASDIGDAYHVIDDCGVTVPPKSPQEFAAAILQYATLQTDDRRLLHEGARRRIMARFQIESAIRRHEKIYRDVVGSNIETHAIRRPWMATDQNMPSERLGS